MVARAQAKDVLGSIRIIVRSADAADTGAFGVVADGQGGLPSR